MAAYAAHFVLSAFHQSLHSSFVSIHSNLLRIRPTSPHQAWTHQGIGLGDMANTKMQPDRKSTRLNSSHANISYAVFCLKKKIPPLRTTLTLNPLSLSY